ncbi:DUF1553 domain-containing protein [Verrucomicrobia bacterium]|nr:DUF1553 domain-containing protein [Verrucomicrobiota bacterium]
MDIRLGIFLVLISSVISVAEEKKPGSAEHNEDYDQVKSLLAAKCYSCHGALKQKAKLRLDTRDLMLKGEVIVPGQATKSLLIERVEDMGEDRMPPLEDGAALNPEEIALLRRWIDSGAKAPAGEPVPLGPSEHWAFKEPKRSVLPENNANPIDILLEKNRAKLGLKMQAQPERTILIRRLYLDLIGLPPTHKQLHDTRAWESIVDELLASPQHGERWARHWMDVWRYSDWYGLDKQLRNSQKHIWRWRDWIVQSLNNDKGYDSMIHEMLAADELAPSDPSAIRATGFLARNYYLFNRTTWLDATIEHTAKAFIGLTLNCAKCHDHKYDPITHEDYYRFRAIFEPHQVRLDPVPGETDLEKDGLPRVFDDHLDVPTHLHIRGNPKNPDKSHIMEPGVPGILADFAPSVEPVKLPAYAYAPASRNYVQKDRLDPVRTEVEIVKKELTEARKKAAETPKEEPKPKSEKETSPEQHQPQFTFKDDFGKPNPELWELIGKGWEYKGGAVHQTNATRDTDRLLLRSKVPRDFEMTCNYTHTGGATYKSVTFRFDVSADRKYANYVYTSAHAPQPKLQVAYSRGGKSTYPSQGLVAQPIEIGKLYTMRIAVRDRLVNVWLNDKFQIAYLLPDRKPSGKLELSGFDATVAFNDFSVRSLPSEVELTNAKNKEPPPDLKPIDSLKVYEAKLAAAEAKLASSQAIFTAEQARGNANAYKQASKRAALLEAKALKAAGKYESKAFATDAGKVKAAQAKIAKAEKKLTETDKATYTPPRVSKKALETPAHKEEQYPSTYPTTSTGRRLALARWITSPKNPLTSRVIVNHVWLRHFGEPLVETVDDFGLRAKPPVQQILLDHLAANFIENGWSFRNLHRLIVTSETYRLSSNPTGADAKTKAADPDNQFYWRMNVQRMDSQVIRDSLLHLAGTLNFTLGGPSLNPDNADRRRSIYFKHSRDQQDKFLKIFNDADHLQCYRRSESIVPQQALALSNGKVPIEMAEKIAGLVNSEDFVGIVFELLLGRRPDAAERRECETTLADLEAAAIEAKKPNATQRARRGLVLALFNHNDFVSIR